MEFEVINILYYCAMILLFTKLFGIVTRKFGLPQVVGMIIAGLLIGPAIFGQLGLGSFRGLVTPSPVEMDVLKSFSQIGVVFILFSSGLETGLQDLKKSGIKQRSPAQRAGERFVSGGYGCNFFVGFTHNELSL